jgi:hypothetical protein
MTVATIGQVTIGEFSVGDTGEVVGTFEIVGDEVVIKVKLQDIGKMITGGNFSLTPDGEAE